MSQTQAHPAEPDQAAQAHPAEQDQAAAQGAPEPRGAGAGHPDPGDEQGARNPWAVLAIVTSGFFLILLDGTSMNIAIPPIQQDLAASYSAAQWMMSGYALAFGLLLIPAGRLGERFGHRRLFIWGMVGFTVSSLLCGTATSAEMVVVWRVVQGLTAGLMNPAILALIHASFAPSQRGRALAWYGATAGVAAALGPVLGGLLIAADLFGTGWRLIFLSNVPIGIVVLFAALRFLPDPRGRGGSLDPVGIALLSAVLLFLIWPLIQGHGAGWPNWVFASLAASALSLVAFVAWQARRMRTLAPPLIDLDLFRSRPFAAGVAITVCQFVAFASLQFVLSAYLQLGLGHSVLATGFALMPFAVGTFVGSTLSNVAVQRMGRGALHCGTGLLMTGTVGVIVTIRLLGEGVDGLWLAPATMLAGMGAMMLGPAMINLILGDVPREQSGTASGIIATASRVGHALGIAVVGTALFSALPTGAPRAATGALAAEYTQAIQVAGMFCLVAAVVTHLLVYLLPRGQGAFR